MFLTDKSILKTLIFVNGQGDNEILLPGVGCQVSEGGCRGGLGDNGLEMTVIRNPYLGLCLLFDGCFSWGIMNRKLLKSVKGAEMQQ